jgi:hypothetical protein
MHIGEAGRIQSALPGSFWSDEANVPVLCSVLALFLGMLHTLYTSMQLSRRDNLAALSTCQLPIRCFSLRERGRLMTRDACVCEIVDRVRTSIQNYYYLLATGSVWRCEGGNRGGVKWPFLRASQEQRTVDTESKRSKGWLYIHASLK